jgi:hypothetical protein
MTNPDEANFCLSCGNKLAGSVATETKLAPTTSDAAVREVKRTTANAGGGTGKAAFAHNVTRAFVLPLLLMVLFISSFFGMFKVYDVGNNIYVPVTGFDAVRGIFLLMNPPTAAELVSDYQTFLNDHEYTSAKKAVRDFGALRMMIYEEGMNLRLILQTIIFGLISLSLMVITLTFFILSLCHAIRVACGKATGFYKFETLPLSLVFALTFVFVVFGGALAGAAIAMLFVAAAGLSAITVLKYVVEKKPRPSVIANVRRGVCAALVAIIAIFASSGLVTIHYKGSDVSAASPSRDLISGIFNPIEQTENNTGEAIRGEASAKDLDKDIGEELSGRYSLRTKRFILRNYLSPVMLCYTDEAVESFETPVKVVSWLMFFGTLFFGAMFVMLLLRMLQEEANPQKQYSTKTAILWNALFVAGAAMILGLTIPYIVMGNSISKSLELHSSYGMSGLIIAAVALGIALIVTEVVMRSVDKGGAKIENNISQNIADEKEQTV